MGRIKWSPGRVIVLGFLSVILIGGLTLMLPVSLEPGKTLNFIDGIFTSTSAVCVTGLVVVDTGDTFSIFGQTIIAVLIQLGGLGIASLGVILIMMRSGKVTIRQRAIVREAYNLYSFKGIATVVRWILLITLAFETAGAVLGYIVFSQNYSGADAVGVSVFHSIAAFNNAGFDIFGEFKSLIDYKDNVLLNLTTAGLITFGGLGFFVIKELIEKRTLKRMSLTTKAVLTTTVTLTVAGTLLLKISSEMTWLEAFFQSVSTRTAGFASTDIGEFGSAALLVVMILMFIGASPGSTGGGIKTTTVFAMFSGIRSAATNQYCHTFKRKVPAEVLSKAFLLTALAFMFVLLSTFVITLSDPNLPFEKIIFEVISAFGTVGLTAGITPELSEVARVTIIITMFIGRLGPLTMITIWTVRNQKGVRFSEENITIG